MQNGLTLLIPTDLLTEFEEEYGTDDQELDLVVFYDASELKRKAFVGTVEEFARSWQRSKWDFFRE